MYVYAIRQKSTGHFLPHRKNTKGASNDIPTANVLPRLFTTQHAAKCALSSWLRGPWSPNTEYDEFSGGWVKVGGATPSRHGERDVLKDDMEVVKMALQDIHPLDDGSGEDFILVPVNWDRRT